MPLKRTTELLFTMSADGSEGDTRSLRVFLHEDSNNRVVLKQDGDVIFLDRGSLPELFRQISEWSAGEPAA